MNSIKKIRDSEMEYFFSTLFARSEEHTSELQSQSNLVCRLLLEKKKKIKICLRLHKVINTMYIAARNNMMNQTTSAILYLLLPWVSQYELMHLPVITDASR